MKVTLPLVAIAALLLVGVVLLQGWGAGLFEGGKIDAIERPDPPCPDDWNEHPGEGICMEDQEVCRAWIDQPRGTRTETVQCPVLSRDGEVYISYDLSLSQGQAQVTILDGAGSVVHEDSLKHAQGSITRSGASGDWTLSVAFSGAQGSGNVYLWG